MALASSETVSQQIDAPGHAGQNKGTMTEPIISLAGVAFAWPGAQAFGIRVKQLDFAAGSKTLLVGPSGCGKSTLLSLICGIVTPQTGSIRVLDSDLTGFGSAGRDRFRAEHIGVIFQMFNLLPYGSPVDNVILPLSFAKARRTRAEKASGDVRAEARRLLQALGIEDNLLRGSAAALSVGQQQRVAAARALIGAPEIIIADEPTSALDPVREDKFLSLLFEQIGEAGSTLLMVSHDERIASRFDQVLQLEDIVQVEQAA